jgi:CheY-like chemotaxis protein
MMSGEVQPDTHASPAKPANVLIVEDERVSRRALAALMSASGYETEALGTAEEALNVVREGVRPDIALVDLDLPGMNGLDFIGQLTQLDPEVFPVLITAANGDNLSNMLRERGVAYMRKPVNFNGLLTLLERKAS